MISPRTRKSVLNAEKSLVRTETLNGKEHLVAPVVCIIAGVHNSEFLAYEEITVFVDAWSGRPLPIDHPTDSNGGALTANSPKVIESSVVGFLFNVVAREDLQGISGEIWVDIEKAATVPGGSEVLLKLNAGEQLEVSTAYFCFIDKVPGEWKNPNGTVEKFLGTQTGVRPDHLALLPFDVGACNWNDGCGAPRVNAVIPADHNINSQDVDNSRVVIANSMPDTKSDNKLQLNGKQLGRALKGALAAHSGDDGTPKAMIDRLAAAAGIPSEKVQALVDGTLDFAPRKWVEIFSAVLDIDGWEVFTAASNDNSDARHTENVKEKIETTVSIVDNKNNAEVETESHEACEPCQKSLKVKIQDVVSNVLKSAGIRWNEAKVEIPMEKKVRVDVLIASDKTQFSENHRDWLMSLNDDQLAAIEPKAEVAAEATPTAEEIAAAAPAATAANSVKLEVSEVKVVEPVKQVITREDVLAALGIDADTIQDIKVNNLQKKTARNAKITEIAARTNCPYSKAEMETFSDDMLTKTLNMLTPGETPFRVAAGYARTADDNTVPAPPAIMLAVREAK